MMDASGSHEGSVQETRQAESAACKLEAQRSPLGSLLTLTSAVSLQLGSSDATLIGVMCEHQSPSATYETRITESVLVAQRPTAGACKCKLIFVH
jgi:hypothetical protein